MGIYEELRPLFYPRNVAIIGASHEKHKVGHIIFKHFVENFKGKTFAINPNTKRILGHKCYPSVNAVKEHIDVAVFAVPARIVPKVMEECVQKKVKVAIIIRIPVAANPVYIMYSCSSIELEVICRTWLKAHGGV